jgi:hypothetical protein
MMVRVQICFFLLLGTNSFSFVLYSLVGGTVVDVLFQCSTCFCCTAQSSCCCCCWFWESTACFLSSSEDSWFIKTVWRFNQMLRLRSSNQDKSRLEGQTSVLNQSLLINHKEWVIWLTEAELQDTIFSLTCRLLLVCQLTWCHHHCHESYRHYDGTSWQKLHSHAYTCATVCSFVSFTHYLIYLSFWFCPSSVFYVNLYGIPRATNRLWPWKKPHLEEMVRHLLQKELK